MYELYTQASGCRDCYRSIGESDCRGHVPELVKDV